MAVVPVTCWSPTGDDAPGAYWAYAPAPPLGAAPGCGRSWHCSSPLVAVRASALLHDTPVVTRERVGVHIDLCCACKRYLDTPLDIGQGAGAREDSGHEVQPSVGL
eukprot:5356167-Prymnesium_polylepis.1